MEEILKKIIHGRPVLEKQIDFKREVKRAQKLSVKNTYILRSTMK